LSSAPPDPSISQAKFIANSFALLPVPVSLEALPDRDRYEFSRMQSKSFASKSIGSETVVDNWAQAVNLAPVPPTFRPQSVPFSPVPSPRSTPEVQQPDLPTSKPSSDASIPLCPRSRDGTIAEIPQSITVKAFEFSQGVNPDGTSQLLPTHEVDNWKLNDLTNEYKHKPLQPSELIEVAAQIAKRYADAGYKTSGAIICIPREASQNGKESVITIRIIKGKLTKINVVLAPKDSNGEVALGSRPPLKAYIESRLGLVKQQPLNINKLLEALQLLQFDSEALIESVTGRLSADVNPGESILDVVVTPRKRTFGAALTTDNNRVPSVGSMQSRATLKESNLLGFGDSLSVGYANSKGSNTWDVNYALPVSPRNTTLSFNYSRSNSAVIEPPFDDLDGDGKTGDIRSSSQSYEISLRHPLTRHIIRPRPTNDNLKTETERKADADRVKREEARGSVFREFAVGLTGSLRDSRTSLLGIPFPLSPGADDNGVTRIFALRFFQEFTQQDAREVLFLRSQFNVGLNVLGATINTPIAGLNDVVPDSRFFFWQGQALWTRRLGSDRQKPPLLTLRANIQLSDRALVSSEQLAIGGFGTVRGYRQDILQSDNGIFTTAELQIPLVRIGKLKQGAFSVIPFVDYGTGWNSAGNAPSPNSLMSTGLGLRFQYDQFTARLDWGIPLISVESRGNTWQDNGIHFSLQWNGL